MANPLSSVLEWLHAGYPDGVPPTDFYPLLALLTRTLEPEELDQIVETLIRENPDGGIQVADVHSATERLTHTSITREELNQVAARLAAAGWPLSDDPAATRQPWGPGADEARPEPADQDLATVEAVEETAPAPRAAAPGSENIVQKIIAWLTEGYPEGIPPTDRVPLMALLRRRLTDEEVHEISERLVDDARSGEIDPADAGVLITRYTDELPSEADLTLLSSHLAAKGWPLRSER